MASKTQQKNTPTPEAPAEETPTPEESKPTAKQRKQLARVMDADLAAWVAEHARPAESQCLCGCGGTTKGRFVPGHDALLKERLAATVLLGTDDASAQATIALAAFAWSV